MNEDRRYTGTALCVALMVMVCGLVFAGCTDVPVDPDTANPTIPVGPVVKTPVLEVDVVLEFMRPKPGSPSDYVPDTKVLSFRDTVSARVRLDSGGIPQQLALTFRANYLRNNVPVRFRRVGGWYDWVTTYLHIPAMKLVGQNAVRKVELEHDPDVGAGMELKVRLDDDKAAMVYPVTTGQRGKGRTFDEKEKEWRNGGLFEIKRIDHAQRTIHTQLKAWFYLIRKVESSQTGDDRFVLDAKPVEITMEMVITY